MILIDVFFLYIFSRSIICFNYSRVKNIKGVNLINNDKEFESVIGYEASERVKEKIPQSIQNISKKLIKSILDHDINLINKKVKNYRPKWRIRDDARRHDVFCYKVGDRILGRVSYVFPTYALVDIGSVKYGVLHARDMSKGWIDRVDLTLTPKEDIQVYIKSINNEYNTIKLSLIDPNEHSSNEVNPDINKDVKDRKYINEYNIEDIVSGIVVRKAPLGYYVDIGANVYGFLHVSDVRNINFKKNKMHKKYYKIGDKLENLYVKSINLIKNRIGLTEYTLYEELQKNVILKKETPNQQSSFLNDYELSYDSKLKIDDIETLKMVGGYDEFLKKIKANRNSSLKYILYLQNLHEQTEIENIQKKLFKNLDNKQQIKNDQNYFNFLSHKLCDLIDSAYEPTNDEKSIYKYGDNKIWKNDIYTPFKFTSSSSTTTTSTPEDDPKDPNSNKPTPKDKEESVINKNYFNVLNNELMDAIKDVQGENFNFKDKYERMNLYDDSYKLINFLFDQFYRKPSNLSFQKDKFTNLRKYSHFTPDKSYPVSDSSNSSQAASESCNPYGYLNTSGISQIKEKDKINKNKMKLINDLLNSDERDEVELGEMLMETKDFNPFEHSKVLNESTESSVIGASKLFQDDVLNWNNKVYNMILSNEIDLDSLSKELKSEDDMNDYNLVKNELEKLVSPREGYETDDEDVELNDDNIENIDPDILKSLEYEDEDQYTNPQIYSPNSSNSPNSLDPTNEKDSNYYDYDSEDEDYLGNDYLETQQNLKEEEEDHLSDNNFEKPPSPNDPKKLKKEERQKDIKLNENKINLLKFIKKLQKNKKLIDYFTNTDSPLTDVIKNLTSSNGQRVTYKPQDNTLNDSKNIINEIKHLITSSSSTTSSELKTTTTAPIPQHYYEDPTPIEDKPTFKVFESLDGLELEDDEDFDDDELYKLINNKRNFKDLMKLVKSNLTPNDKNILNLINKDDFEEDKLLNYLKNCYSNDTNTKNYKYYKEGYDKYLSKLDEYNKNTNEINKFNEMNHKFNILIRNRSFINMLHMLNIDPNKVNIDNISQLLPHQYTFKRLTPSSSTS